MKKYIKSIGILAFSLTLMFSLTLTSCKDDHFDVNSDVRERQTVWEVINTTPELSEFAYFLSHTYYSKSESSSTPATYADLLSDDQTFTVWAPANGTFDFDLYKNTLDLLGNVNYVEKELIRNNIARYRFMLSGAGSREIDLLNDKTATFDCANRTMGGNSVTTPNISCSNGVIHITNGSVPYKQNLMEFIEKSENLDSLRFFLKSYEELRFDEYASTQGPTVNGNITWVDSVTHKTNNYLNSIGAYLTSEDSLYAMILPSDTAWRSIINKTKTYYNFLPTYTQTIVTVDKDGNERSEQVTTTYTPLELDSMLNLYSKSAICDNLVFNANYQFKKFDPYNPWNCDSLESTNRTKFKAPFVQPLFDGNNKPEVVSNGYAYVVDNFNFRFNDTWASKLEYEAEYTRNIENNTRCTLSNYTGTFERNDSIIKYSVVRTLQSSSSSNPEITFKLQNTLSCKYDIYLLMAYNVNAEKPCKFKATLGYHDGKKATQATSSLPSDEADTLHYGGKNVFTNRPPYVDEKGYLQYVDTIPLAKDFLFPVSYYRMDDAYVTLKIASNVTSRESATFTREMWIDKIIFVAKENE